MIDLNKIPGFEKTPEEINTIDDAVRVLKIAGLTGSCINIMSEDIEQLKKLLGDRRDLLRIALFVLQNCYHALSQENRDRITKKVEEITCLSWEELQK